MDKFIRQKHFIPKELRYSIAFIIISSLVAGILIIYLAKTLGNLVEEKTLPVILIMVSYTIVVAIFTLVFSHRFIGPFERLKMEVRLFRAGDYQKRLTVRTRDDVYIKSFVNEINLLMEECHKICSSRTDFTKALDPELMDLLAMMEKGECTKERLVEVLVLFREKVRALAGKNSS